MGADRPKQFIEVFGKPILAYTIEKFQKHRNIDGIAVVCVKEYIDYLKKMSKEYHFSKVKWIVPGGDTFQQSVMNGLNYIRDDVDERDMISIHYGAAPFVTEDIISDGIRVCAERGNSVSIIPCFALLGSNDGGGKSTKWIDRDNVIQLNTPQNFYMGDLLKLYQEAEERNILDKTDPHTTSLMHALGYTIYFSKGNQTNIKITTEEDIELFKGYVMLKENRV